MICSKCICIAALCCKAAPEKSCKTDLHSGKMHIIIKYNSPKGFYIKALGRNKLKRKGLRP